MMKTLYRASILCCVLCVHTGLYSQTEQQLKRMELGKNASRPDELVSMKADVSYAEAVKSLGELSKKLTGKIIVDSGPMKNSEKAIGINVEAMYWRDALELILRSNQLWYNEYPEYFELVSIQDVGKTQAGLPAQQQQQQLAAPGSGQMPMTALAKVDSGDVYAKMPEVTISSIFLELNTTKINESGVSFSIFRGRDLNLGVEFNGADKVSTPILSLTAAPTGNKVAVDITSAIKVFETEQFGEVIARPQVTVRAGSAGRVQIGQDFSVKQRDFAGNVTDVFIHSGVILETRPIVYKVGELQFIDLAIHVEKSTASPGAVSTIVAKSTANSRLSLLDGEESYIGGLYQNDESTIREGVPVLKDLPWWVFGLRYLFGYDNKTVTRKELVVIIKADIVPLLEERAKTKQANRDVQQEKLKEMRQDLNKRMKKN